jgi:tetratricopeptide (TPR) repeat protein
MKKRISDRLAIGVLFLLLFAISSSAQEKSDPAWILFEKGKSFYEKRDYGMAMKFFQEAIQKSGMFPEAEVAIGDVYYLEGEFALAEMQYEKAARIKNAFYIPDDKYAVLLKLSSLHESQEKYSSMEEDLLSILADDSQYADPKWSQLRTQIEDNFYRKGLDHVLMLYQLDSFFAIRAHAKLGWFYYRSGRLENSIQHSLFALIAMKSELTQVLRSRDPDFEFESLSKLFKTEPAGGDVFSYMKSSGAFRCLYYFACSVYWGTSYSVKAAEIWKLLSETTQAGEYAELSAKQLKKPWMEPPLEVLRKK